MSNFDHFDVIKTCRKCKKKSVPEDGDGDVDPCLGVLPGVANACCGHGISGSYIQFENGVTVRGFEIDKPRSRYYRLIEFIVYVPYKFAGWWENMLAGIGVTNLG